MPMPSWWRKSKSKEETFQRLETPHGKLQPNKKKISGTEKPHKSFDDRITLTGSRDLASGSSSGFSGFESDSNEKRGIPLPRPSDSDLGLGGLGSIGSVSGSVSSVSSSGSTGEDHPVGIDLPNSQLGGYRVHSELKINPGLRIPGPGSRSPGPGSRSPGPGSRSPCPGSRSPGPGSRSPCPGSRSSAPGSRGASRPTSPLHPRLVGVGLDSPTGRLEDGKSQCHPLPLPPTSPSSSSQPSTRCNGVGEIMPIAPSTWKKGKLLGRGTFGHVYLGFNSVSGQMCAIKEVRLVSDDQTSKECLKQLNQEINLLSQLTHPNIVRYYGSELSEETLSVYLEYVSGGSIHKLLQEYGPFKEPVIQNYTRQILSGLAYLHGRNTVHRDIKGANILVDPNGEIKLADFGMAKHITNFSSMLSFKGSPYWMAPEVVMNTNGYSLPVDIWSLGCTILEMATSKPPWSQYEGVAAIFKIGNSKDMPDIPDHLSSCAKNFIKLCLQRDPLLRPTAVQLLDHSFIRDQSTSRSFGFGMTADASPYAFDGSRSPPPLELCSNRPSSSLGDVDIAMKPAVTNARALRGPRGDVRTITSLPVSPSSSPLRQYGPAHKSCFLSPPQPTYASMGQKGYDFSDFPLYPLRPSTTYPLDPFNDAPFLQGQTPRSSPRMRPNLNM